jgi:tetratricopeptide (TPR) repeat protein
MIYLEALEPYFLKHHQNLSNDSTENDLVYAQLNQVIKPYYGAYSNLAIAFINQESLNTLKLQNNTQSSKIEPTFTAPVYDIVETDEKLDTSAQDDIISELPIIIEHQKSAYEILTPIVIPVEQEVNNTVQESQKKYLKNIKTSNKKKKKSKKIKLQKFTINPLETEKDDFTSWIYKLKPIQGGNTENIIKKTKKEKKKNKIDREIEKSVLMGEDIVSESLADLYEKQGHIELAIEMFQKLNLKYPEKSSYFASKILELKSK